MAEGEQILKAIRQVREFFGEVANLLQTIDSMMQDAGWAGRGNACLYETSGRIQQPNGWMPSYIYRFYTSARKPSVLLSACAVVEILDPIPEPFIQPLLVGQLFDFGNLKGDQWAYDASYANWHLWVRGRTDDGKTYSVNPRVDLADADDKCKAEKMKSFARPLVEFTNRESLKAMFVLPLLNTANYQ